jgi:hypothetical protein
MYGYYYPHTVGPVDCSFFTRVAGASVLDPTRLSLETDDDDDDDAYLKKIATRVSQNLILHKFADHPKA